MTDKEQIMNNFEKDINVLTKAKLIEQLISKTQECEELKIKLMQKDEVNTFFNTPIEGWSSDPCGICESKNNYEQLKQECKELKQYQEDAEKVLKNILDNFDKMENRYRKALEEIEEIVKETCRKRCTNDCLGTRKHCGYGAIFNIINKAKGSNNDR